MFTPIAYTWGGIYAWHGEACLWTTPICQMEHNKAMDEREEAIEKAGTDAGKVGLGQGCWAGGTWEHS